MRASKGQVAGGKVLGYANERIAGSHVARVVDPAQARIVLRIFQLAADGKGILKIAKALNAEGVPNPTGQTRQLSTKRSDKWASGGIREVLHRELYRTGRTVYGKTRWVDRGGTKVKQDAPEAEWIVLDNPELAIVPEALWNAAQARLDASRRSYLRRNDGQLGGKPEAGLESKYLLSGFLRCGECGGNMFVNKRTGQARPAGGRVRLRHAPHPRRCRVQGEVRAPCQGHPPGGRPGPSAGGADA